MPRNNKSPRNGLRRDTATQTGEDDTFLEIARLQEQVKLLSIENKVLREHKLEQSSEQIRSTPRKNKTNNNLIEDGSKSKKKNTKGCTCKGNCSTKICGCVKKDGKCSHLCKCDSELCRNQADEDKSPTVAIKSEGSYSENEEHLTAISSASESYEDDSSFDPTKPKHQLARTPPRSSSASTSSLNEITRISDIVLPPPIPEVAEEEPPTPPELLQVHVDWSKHQAELVPCDKCHRKFYPLRILKHKKVCKGV